jgi:fructose-bisphosphate aldolase class II
MKNSQPLPGALVFEALRDKNVVLLACNTRITKGIARGIFRAARDADAVVAMELSRSECDLARKGYTGLLPSDYARLTKEAAREVSHDAWILHGDHIFIKKGTPEELKEVKNLIKAQIDAGYTSFAIDASHLFNFEGKTTREQLEPNIRVTIELAQYIKEHAPGQNFGLEVEVGEIGRKDSDGLVKTTPEEAEVFIKALNAEGIYPQVLAIANGSVHGNIYRAGKLVEQTDIDFPRTRAITTRLHEIGAKVKIAQHGITGTPLSLIKKEFPSAGIIKGNVGTHWLNIVWDVLKVYQPELYTEIFNWTLDNFGKEGVPPEEVFGNNGKRGIKVFFHQIYGMRAEAEKACEAMAYAWALMYLEAFNAFGSAKYIREKL